MATQTEQDKFEVEEARLALRAFLINMWQCHISQFLDETIDESTAARAYLHFTRYQWIAARIKYHEFYAKPNVSQWTSFLHAQMMHWRNAYADATEELASILYEEDSIPLIKRVPAVPDVMYDPFNLKDDS